MAPTIVHHNSCKRNKHKFRATRLVAFHSLTIVSCVVRNNATVVGERGTSSTALQIPRADQSAARLLPAWWRPYFGKPQAAPEKQKS